MLCTKSVCVCVCVVSLVTSRISPFCFLDWDMRYEVVWTGTTERRRAKCTHFGQNVEFCLNIDHGPWSMFLQNRGRCSPPLAPLVDDVVSLCSNMQHATCNTQKLHTTTTFVLATVVNARSARLPYTVRFALVYLAPSLLLLHPPLVLCSFPPYLVFLSVFFL